MPFGIALLLIWLVLLLRFPRVMLPLSGVVVALALTLAAGVGVKQWQDGRQTDQLHISIQHLPAECEFGKPLRVLIDNQSKRTANNISWQLLATQPGYNSSVLDVSVNDAIYHANRALPPGEQWQQCYAVPRLRQGYRAPDLLYRAQRVRAEFHN
ncbi:MAG: hypothetical protein ACK4VV_02645 [Pseudomonas sp.]